MSRSVVLLRINRVAFYRSHSHNHLRSHLVESQKGTVANGAIVLDGEARLAEGERAPVEVMDSDDMIPMPEPYDREKELAILREALEDVRAGWGRPAREFLNELASKFNLPLATGERVILANLFRRFRIEAIFA